MQLTTKLLALVLLLLFVFLGSRISVAQGDVENAGSTELETGTFNSVTERPINISSETSDEEIVKKWQVGFTKMKNQVKSLVKRILPHLISSSSNVDAISPACRKAVIRFLSALQRVEPWALYMLDSTGKGMSGILTGTLTSLGSFDECLDAVATETKRNITKELFRGQYCTLKVRPYLPKKPKIYSLGKRLEAFKVFENDTGIFGEMTKHVQLFYTLPFRFGVCVPSACSTEDIHAITILVVGKFLDYEVLEPSCEVKEPNKVEDFQIPVIAVFVLLLALVLCGTCAELILLYLKHRGKQTTKESSTGMKCLLSFSAYNNFMMLLDTDTASDKLKVLHGVRVYSISWIVLGHTFYYVNYSMVKHLKLTIEISRQMAFGIVGNASLLVDNFFFISGLLMTYVTMNVLEKTGRKLNVFHFVLHRIWRFLPIHMAFVGITLLLPWMGAGPLWHETVDPLVNGCRTGWWTNLLFINNVYRTSLKGCVSYSWYLAADLQLYIFSLVVLIPLLRKPKLGLFINFSLIAAQILTSGLYNYLNDLPPGFLFSNADEEQRIQLQRRTYYVPYQHLGPYCIGIFIGYLMQAKKPPKRIHPVIQVLAWIVTFAVSSTVLFGLHEWNNGNDPGKVTGAMYAALCRVCWTSALAWITYACSSGYGGVLTKLLSWKPLIPLSRLTFLLYMIHPLIQIVVYANVREGFQAENYPAVFFFFSVLISGYGLAAILCMFLESPFINLGRIIFESRRQHSDRVLDTSRRKSEQTQDKLNTGTLETVSFEPPLTNLNHHSSEAELVVSETSNKASDRKAFENGAVVYHL